MKSPPKGGLFYLRQGSLTHKIPYLIFVSL